MSFIDKALERAKALQQKKKESPGPRLEKEAPPPRIPPFTAQDSFSPPVTAEGISYTTTRTVPVNLANLHGKRLLVGPQEPAVVEEYKLLRTHILQRTKGEGRNTLMITGPLPKEGKTLTAINLAISISQEVNQTVLLVDADLRYPFVHRYFGIPARPGLVDYLTSGYPVSELLVNPEGLPKLVILPGRQAGGPCGGTDQFSPHGGFGSRIETLLPRPLCPLRPPAVVVLCRCPGLCAPGGRHNYGSGSGKDSQGRHRALPSEMLKNFPLLGFVLNKVETVTPGHIIIPKRTAGQQ